MPNHEKSSYNASVRDYDKKISNQKAIIEFQYHYISFSKNYILIVLYFHNLLKRAWHTNVNIIKVKSTSKANKAFYIRYGNALVNDIPEVIFLQVFHDYCYW